MAGFIATNQPKVPQGRQKFWLSALCAPACHARHVLRGFTWWQKPEIAKRTQFVLQVSINKKDTHVENLPIKVNQNLVKARHVARWLRPLLCGVPRSEAVKARQA